MRERDDRQHDEQHRAGIKPAADPLPVDAARPAGRRTVVAATATGRLAAARRFGRRRFGGVFFGGGGLPSSARLTTSIGSRKFGSISLRTGGRIVVGRTSGGTAARAPRRLAVPASAGVVTAGVAPVSAAWRPDAPSATDPRGLSGADGSWRSSLFTGRARAVARRSCAARLGRTRSTEHVRLHQVVPTAGPAYLHHMYCELVESGCQQDQFLGGTR